MTRYDRPLTVEDMMNGSDEDPEFSDIPEADADFWPTAKAPIPERLKTLLNMRRVSDVGQGFRALSHDHRLRGEASRPTGSGGVVSGHDNAAGPQTGGVSL
jgi:hypothetical protein